MFVIAQILEQTRHLKKRIPLKKNHRLKTLDFLKIKKPSLLVEAPKRLDSSVTQ